MSMATSSQSNNFTCSTLWKGKVSHGNINEAYVISQTSSIACQSSQVIMSTSGIMASSTPLFLPCSYLSYEVGVVVALASMWMTSSSCMGMASSSSTMYIFSVGGIIISKLDAS